MEYLKALITDQTPIIDLHNDSRVSNKEKIKIMGKMSINRSSQKRYFQMMYYMNDTWYFFKKDENRKDYPFHLTNELIGSYIVKSRGLKPCPPLVAKTKNGLGLATINFKKEGYDYHFGDYFQCQYEIKTGLPRDASIDNFARLRYICSNSSNTDKLIDELLNLTAIDLYMFQIDRGKYNLQFVVNKQTKEVSLSNIYDFSNCLNEMNVDSNEIFLKTCILNIYDETLPQLFKTYPEIIEYLYFLIDQGYIAIWNTICDDYHFNKDTQAYDEIATYYQAKEENQKKKIHELIKKYT